MRKRFLRNVVAVAAAAVCLSATQVAYGQTPGYIPQLQNIQAFDSSSGVLLSSISSFPSYYVDMAVSADGSTLYVPEDGAIFVIATQTGSIIATIPMPSNSTNTFQPTKVVLSPSTGQLFAMGTTGGVTSAVVVVSLTSMRVTRYIQASTQAVGDIAVSPDGTTLWVATSTTGYGGPAPSGVIQCNVTGGVCAFDTSTFALKGKAATGIGVIGVSQDGKSVYVCAGNTYLRVVNASTFAVSQIGLPQGFLPTGILVSPVGTSAIVFSNATTTGLTNLTGLVLNTSTNKLVARFPGPVGGGMPLAALGFAAFTPDGTKLWMLTACVPDSSGCDSQSSVTPTMSGLNFPSGETFVQTALPEGSGTLALPK